MVNHRTSAAPFERLQRSGIPTHYLETLSHGEMLCHRLDIIKGTLDLDRLTRAAALVRSRQ